MWLRVTVIVVLIVIIGVLLALWFAQSQWHSAAQAMQQRLLAASDHQKTSRYSESELTALPLPVARYFRTVLKDGQPIIVRADITWKGEFNIGKPDADKWVPFTATQVFLPAAPGFIWDARIPMGPGLSTFVRDSFVAGTGAMLGKIAGLVTVVNSHDTPAITSGALQRYLGEAAWLPTALLPSHGTKWEPLDDHRARATISGGGVTTSLEFRFGDDGLITSAYAPARTFDNGKDPPSPHPWQARNIRYGEFNGIKVPIDSTVEWLFPNRPYAYWRGQPVDIRYEYAPETSLQ